MSEFEPLHRYAKARHPERREGSHLQSLRYSG
jgi:hypothetical protein